MTDTAADRWEFSILVDQASRILEACGMFEVYLGARANQITGRQLLSFIDDSERLPFLRYMARLLVRGEAEVVSATLRTPAVGIKRFSMAAKTAAAGQRSWWIMFAQEIKGQTAAAPHLGADKQSFATEQELGVIAGAHDHAASPLDITVFRARALSDDTSSTLSPEVRKAIDEKLGQRLQDHAHQGIVARPGAGEYALLHSRDERTEDIQEQLVAVAAEHNLQAQDLGLTHETRHVEADTTTANIIKDLRRKLHENVPAAVVAPAPPRRNRMPLYVAAAGCCVVLIAGFLLLRM